MTVCAVNVLSCGSLALFFAGYLTALGEINCELAFLLIKWVIEVRCAQCAVPTRHVPAAAVVHDEHCVPYRHLHGHVDLLTNVCW